MAKPSERQTLQAVVYALGGGCYAASFAHILQVARDHGQRGWVAWLIAGTVEVLLFVGMMQLRRAVSAPAALALLLGSGMSVAANLDTSDGTRWGYAFAVWPAVVFLLVVWMAEASTIPGPRPEPAAPDVPQMVQAVVTPALERFAVDMGRMQAEVADVRERLDRAPVERPKLTAVPPAPPSGGSLKDQAKAAALAYQREHGAWPGRKKLAEVSRLSEGTCRDALRELTDTSEERTA